MARLNPAVLSALQDRLQRDVEVGLEHGGVEGCAGAVALNGEVLWEEGFGAAKADTPILLFSISKTVLESALWLLYAGKTISPDTAVVDIIPDFMEGTEPSLTIGMVETHLGSFAFQPLDYPACADRANRLAAFRGWRTTAPVGSRYEYHPMTGAWVLAEIIERVAGQDYRAFLRQHVLEPLGLAGVRGVSLGEPADELRQVLLHRNYMSGYSPDPAKRQRTSYGLDTVAGLALGTPGAGAVGTAGGVAKLYQHYLHNHRGLWDKAILDDVRYRTRVEMPDPSGRPMRRSLSFVQAGDVADRYGERTFFGSKVSAGAFGHQGQGGQIAWADPQSGLSFAYLTNTVVFPPGGCFHPRARELSTLAAQLLG